MTISNTPFVTRICRYDMAALREAAALIRGGDLVAVPTETVYGLAADASDSQAVAGIYTAKGRPNFNPLIVHVDGMEMAERIAEFPPVARRIAEAYWPGPVTLVLPHRTGSGISPLVTAGLPTIALRMPGHLAMQALIRESGRPLAAPSANASGGISPTCAEHVLSSLAGRVRMILDDGPTREGLESTIIAPEADCIRLLRPGPVTAEALAALTGLPVAGAHGGTIEAPGQMTSHYAPKKPVRLNVLKAEEGEYLIGFGPIPCDLNLSAEANLSEAAANLFAALHQADASAARAIAIAPIPDEGIGMAINDRLRRAAA